MAEEQVQTLPSPFPFRPGSIGFAGSKKPPTRTFSAVRRVGGPSLFLLHSTLLHHRVSTPSEL